jgi:hypothetical protein
MVNTRQRAVCLVRVVNIYYALTVLPLFLQQSVALPQEAGFSGAARRVNRFTGTTAQGVIMVVRREAAFRPGACCPYQPVVFNITKWIKRSF